MEDQARSCLDEAEASTLTGVSLLYFGTFCSFPLPLFISSSPSLTDWAPDSWDHRFVPSCWTVSDTFNLPVYYLVLTNIQSYVITKTMCPIRDLRCASQRRLSASHMSTSRAPPALYQYSTLCHSCLSRKNLKSHAGVSILNFKPKSRGLFTVSQANASDLLVGL
jgi:hypothetical protein